MNKYLLTSLFLAISTISIFSQSNEGNENKPTLKKVAWLSEGGLGYQSFDPSALKSSLKANNYSSDLSSHLIMLNYGFRAVFFDKLSAGLYFETGSTSDFVRSGTSVGLNKLGAGFKLGYDIFTKKNHKISLLYQLGLDVNLLNLQDNERSLPDFGAALDQRTSHTLFSGNTSHRFLVRYDYLFKQIQDEKAVVRPALGIEIGYNVAGNNSWDDVVNGPKIDNSGLFVNLVYSAKLRKYKKAKPIF